MRGGAAEGEGRALQPVVRLLETAEGYALVAVNHRKEAVRIEVEFNAGYVREEGLSISLEGQSGAVRFVEVGG